MGVEEKADLITTNCQGVNPGTVVRHARIYLEIEKLK